MNTPWAGLAAVVVCAGVCGCAGRGDPEPMHPLGPTLLIINESSLVYQVTVSASLQLQVHPGQRKCVWAGRFSEARRIRFLALASSTSYSTPRENLMSAPGWVVEIGQQPRYDVLSLRPAEPCME